MKHVPARSRDISRRRFLRGALASAGAIATGPVILVRPGWAAVAPPRGAHLAFGADPRSEMTVSWYTAADVAATLEYGDSPEYGATAVVDSRAVETDNPVYALINPTTSRYHHAKLAGLESGHEYHYRLRSSDSSSDEFLTGSFRTAPTSPGSFSFTAFGDQGVTADGAATTSRVLAANPAFHFHVGDLCYAHVVIGIGLGGPTNQMVWDQWFDQISGTGTAGPARTVPWMTTVGNHEMEPGYGPLGYDGYHARFTVPSAAPEATYYSFRYGNVGVIALDANDASYEIPTNTGYTGGAQDAWLAGELAAMRAEGSGIDFIVVGFHHCAYCSNPVHASDAAVRERWQGLFDQYGVDLVINGHNHCYERTHPLRGGEVKRTVVDGDTFDSSVGTTYVTAGGGGQRPYPYLPVELSYVTIVGGVRVPEEIEWSATRLSAASLIVANVFSEGGVPHMTIRAELGNGEKIEEITLRRG